MKYFIFGMFGFASILSPFASAEKKKGCGDYVSAGQKAIRVKPVKVLENGTLSEDGKWWARVREAENRLVVEINRLGNRDLNTSTIQDVQAPLGSAWIGQTLFVAGLRVPTTHEVVVVVSAVNASRKTEHSFSLVNPKRGTTPRVAFLGDGTVVVAYESFNENRLAFSRVMTGEFSDFVRPEDTQLVADDAGLLLCASSCTPGVAQFVRPIVGFIREKSDLKFAQRIDLGTAPSRVSRDGKKMVIAQSSPSGGLSSTLFEYDVAKNEGDRLRSVEAVHSGSERIVLAGNVVSAYINPSRSDRNIGGGFLDFRGEVVAEFLKTPRLPKTKSTSEIAAWNALAIDSSGKRALVWVREVEHKIIEGVRYDDLVGDRHRLFVIDYLGQGQTRFVRELILDDQRYPRDAEIALSSDGRLGTIQQDHQVYNFELPALP